MTPTRRSERGVALAMVLVAGALVSLTVAIALNATGYRFHATTAQVRHGDSYYVSETGIQWVWAKLDKDVPPFDTNPDGWPLEDGGGTDAEGNPFMTDTMPVGNRTVTVTVTRIGQNPDRFRISATTEI